jgi:hypothetical protein
MYEMRTEIDIAASPEAVWEALTDSSSFDTWNPFIRRMEGELHTGNTIEIEVGTEGKSRLTFKPRLLRVEPGKELRWRGKLLLPGIFDGEHIFELHATEGGTRLVHREEFSGILVPFLRGKLERDTLPGFEAMNRALKERVETAPTPVATADDAG